MTIEIREVTPSDGDTWNEYVERSEHADLFHRRAALEVQATYSDARVHYLVGYKGQEPVGIFPVFHLQRGPVSTAFSPPPELRIPSLGPALLNMEKLKQRKAERRHVSFVENCFEWIDERIGPRYGHFRISGAYPDVRPFKWNGCDVTPSYTYLVDLTPDQEELLLSFSGDARRNIRDGRDAEAVTVGEEGRDAIPLIIEQVRRRYESQDVAFHLDDDFVIDLYERLPEGSVRPYVCRVDGEFVGGIVAYEHGEAIRRWQGGVRVDADVDVSVNDLLDWAVMRDGRERGRSTYDLVGAENRRINGYKAKFNPDVREYYSLERSSPVTAVAARLYDKFRSTSFEK